MRSGLYGRYKGIEYEITVDMEGNVKVLTEDIDKIDTTFNDTYNSGVYTKVIQPDELTECLSITTYGLIEGEKVQILKERQKDYQVATNSFEIGVKLNLPRVDRDSWIGWIPINKIEVLEDISILNPKKLTL